MKMPFETTIDYTCGKCGLHGVKLWRGFHGWKFEDKYDLLCAKCVAPQGVHVNEKGKAMCGELQIYSDQVGGGLPAVPVDSTYYGYTSIPDEGVTWWVGLPTYAEGAK